MEPNSDIKMARIIVAKAKNKLSVLEEILIHSKVIGMGPDKIDGVAGFVHDVIQDMDSVVGNLEQGVQNL